jgi:hypothetical protein
MASALLRGARQFPPAMWRGFAMVATGVDIVAAAPGVALQKARTWDEGVSSNFSTTPLKELFLVSLFSPSLSVSFIYKVIGRIIAFVEIEACYSVLADIQVTAPSVTWLF